VRVADVLGPADRDPNGEFAPPVGLVRISSRELSDEETVVFLRRAADAGVLPGDLAGQLVQMLDRGESPTTIMRWLEESLPHEEVDDEDHDSIHCPDCEAIWFPSGWFGAVKARCQRCGAVWNVRRDKTEPDSLSWWEPEDEP
jgi:uncharacterized paraquat-inducible protein A